MGGDQDIQSLDRELMRLQKSTRTTVPALLPLHDVLRQRFNWYYNWHLWPWSKFFHALFLVVFILGIGGIFYQVLLGQPQPVTAAVTTETLRPDADNTIGFTGVTCSAPHAACTYHYEAVDEVGGDDATSYISSGAAVVTDLFDFPSITLPSGKGIGKIRVGIRATTSNPNPVSGEPCIKSGSTTSCGTSHSFANPGIWEDYYTEWTTDPADGSYWTELDVNALQIGVKAHGSSPPALILYVTQVYIIAYYGLLPTVSASPASDIQPTSATLNGNISALGDDTQITARGFRLWQAASCGGTGSTDIPDTAPGSPWSGVPQSYSEPATGLTEGQDYAYYAYATSSYGTGWSLSSNCETFKTTSGISISGTASIASSCSGTVAVAVNGVKQGQTGSIIGTAPNCTWSISGVTVASTNPVTVWIDEVADEAESTAVAKYDGSDNMSGMVLNPNTVSIGSGDNAIDITAANVGSYVNGSDEDVMITWASPNLNVKQSYTDPTINILASNTLIIGATETLTANNITTTGTLTCSGSGANIAASGNIDFSSGTFNKGSLPNYSTITMSGTSKTLTGGLKNLYNLTINGTITASNSNVNIYGALLVNAGKTLSIDDSRRVIMQAGSTTTIQNTGTVQKSASNGRLDFYDSAGSSANLATTGTLTANNAFYLSTTSITIPNRTYGGSVYFLNSNTSGANYELTLGTSATAISIGGFLNVQTVAGAGTLTVRGDTNNPAVSIGTYLYYTKSGGTASVLTGTGTWSIGSYLNLAGGSITAGGAVSVTSYISAASAGTMTMGGGTWTVGDAVNLSNITVAANSSTLQMNGASTITGNSQVLNNFTVNNTVAASGSFSVNGTFAVNSGKTFSPAADSIISGATGTLTGSGTAVVTTTGADAFLTQYTIANKTLTNLTVSYRGAAAQTVSATTYGNLDVNMAGQIATLGGTTTVGGNLTITAGTLAGSDKTMNLAGNWSNSGTFTCNTSTVNFNAGTTGKTIASGGQHFYIVTFNNAAGGWTFSDSQNVDNDFTITAAQDITLGAFTHTMSGNVTLGGTTLTTTGSTLKMDAGSSKNLIGASKTLNNLTISGTISIATSDVSVGGTLTVDNTKTLTIPSGRSVNMNAGSTTNLNTSGTITGPDGSLLLVDSAGATLSTGGTLSSRVAFRTVNANVTVPARNYGWKVYIQNLSNATAYSAILGTAAGQTINIASDLTISALYSKNITLDASVNNPTVNITGTGNVSFNKPSSGTPSITMYSGVDAANPWTIGGNFTLANGSINMGSVPMTVSGNVDLTTTGTFTAGTSTLVMSGASKTLTPNGATFNNITFSNTILCANNFAVNGILNVNGGNFSPSAGTVTMNNGSAISNSGTLLFSNLTIADSATMTGNNTFGVGGTFTVGASSTFSPAASTVVSGGTGTLTGSGTVKVPYQAASAFATQYTIANKNLTSLTVDYTGTSAGGQTLTDTTYGSAGSGVLKISGTLNSLTQTAKVGGVFTMNSGTFTPGDGTITMNTSSSIANTAGTLAFYNLTIAGTGVTSARVFTINGELKVNASSAFTHTNTITMATANWEIKNLAAPTALSLKSLTISETPTVRSDVSFSMSGTLGLSAGKEFAPTGGTITMTGGGISAGSGTLTFSNLTVTGTVNASSNWSINGALSVSASGNITGSNTTLNNDSSISVTAGGNLQFGNLYVANNAITTAAGDFKIAGSLTLNNAGSSLVISSGTVTNAGNITITTNGGTLTFNNLMTVTTWYIQTASSFSINGILTVDATSTGNFSASAGTITMTGGSIVNNNAANKLTFYNLAIANNATVATASSFTIAENLSVGTGTATFAPSAGTITFSSGAIANSGTLTFNDIVLAGAVSSSSSFSVAGNWTNNSSFSHSLGTVTLSGAGAQSVSGNTTFNNLDITTNAARAITFAGNSTTTVPGTWNVTGQSGKVITMQSSDANNWTINPTAANVTYTNVSRSNNNGVKFCAGYSNNSGNNGGTTGWYFDIDGLTCKPNPVDPSISGTALSISEIQWNFTDTANDEDGFKLYDHSNALIKDCPGANLTNCPEGSLSTNSAYMRKVRPYNSFGDSESFSNEVTVYTKAAKPNAPDGVTAQSWDSVGNPLQLTLQAGGNPSDTDYFFQYKEVDTADCGDTTGYLQVSGSWIALSQDQTQTYRQTADKYVCFRAKAKNHDDVDDNDYSDPSTPVQAAPAKPAISDSLNTYAPAAEITESKIVWNWDPNAVGNSGYKVYRQGTDALICTTPHDTGTRTCEDATGLSVNTSYGVYIKAYRTDVYGEPTAQKSAYTAIESVTAALLTDRTTTSITTDSENTPSNIDALHGSSGLHYCYYHIPQAGGEESLGCDDWKQNTDPETKSPLAVNDQYKVTIQSKNGDSRTSGDPASITRYTLANAPVTAGHDDTALTTNTIKWTWSNNDDPNPAWTEYCVGDDDHCSTDTFRTYSDPAWTANSYHALNIYAKNGNHDTPSGERVNTDTINDGRYTAIEQPDGTIIYDDDPGLEVNRTPNSIFLKLNDTLSNLDTAQSGIQFEEVSGNQNGGGDSCFKDNTWCQNYTAYDVGLKGSTGEENPEVGTTYKYKVKARNADGVDLNQYSDEFEFTTTAGTQLLFQLPGETLDENGGTHLLSYADDTPTEITAGVPFSITIDAADGADYRDLAHADTITLSSSKGAGAAEFPAAAAMSSGAITYNNVILKEVGAQTISGSGSAGSSHEVIVVAGTCSASVSTATASPTSLDVDQTSTVTITIKDGFGNALAGHTVSVSSNQGSDNITFSAAQTDANGRIYAYVTSEAAHTSTITVSDTTDGITLDDQPQITFNAVVPPPTPTPTPTATATATPTPTPTPGGTPTGDTEAPTAPSNLRATDITTTTIDLAWDPSTDNVGVAGYQLYNADTNILIATTTQTIYSLTGLTPNATYRFYVRAYDAIPNYSSFSNILTITTRPPETPEEKKIEEEGGEVAYLVMGNLPKEIDAGQALSAKVRVSVADAGGRIVTAYSKAIYFSSSDKDANLTFNNKNMYTFTNADAGIHDFAGRDFVLNTAGKQKLSVSDYSTTSTAEIMVKAAGALPIVQNFLAKPENISKVNTGVVTTTAVVLLFPLLINTVLNFATLLPQIIYWLTQILQLLGIRKRRKSWGVVFNSQTGQPISLAMVRIIDKKYNRVLEQAVTDNQGRYGFLVREGTFYMTVTKSGFVFPSKEKSSSFYEKIYVGGDFKVAGKEQSVAYNIPLDPHVKPSSIFSLWVFFIKFNRLLEKLRLPLLVIGIIFSVIMMVIAFELIYLLSLIFYILLGILEYLRTRKARPYGVVTDTFNHPLEMTIVRIYKKENNRLMETDVTDRDGRFRFLVAPGVYYVVASKPAYIDFKSHLMYLQKEKTLVSTTIKLKKEEK